MSLGKIKTFLSKNTIIPIWIVFFIFAVLFVPGFFNVNNLFNVFNQNAMKGILAIGMTFVIINSYFDMSTCTLVALAASLACGLEASIGIIPGILIALLTGCLVGAINGFLVAYARINAFVVTLAMMLGCRGIGYIYHAEQSLIPNHTEAGWAFIDLGAGKIGPLSYISIIFIVLLLLAHFVLKYTTHGRNTYAVGGNENSAFNAGIDYKRTTLINFIICGFTGALGGILYAAFAGSSTPTLGWPDMHMLVIAGVVLGGCKLTGGVGNIWYTLGGIMLLGVINNMMNLLNVQTYINRLVTGLIMIGVLYLDKIMMDKKTKKANLE